MLVVLVGSDVASNQQGRRGGTTTRALHAYLRWRNQNARHPDVLAAQRRERAHVRSERGLRWGGRPLPGPAQPARSQH
ncbi:hypothetical protein DVA86_22480 [Streptomyces armeniacus]|uniref:Uncharacterized protein n=1 Tax=Streptomyces armeniacus TaxID=83291 RepID=A0A345XTN4_9ACTN|nr:hypothetical protein DVA86_22480 [Streptomyces armeniacus]